MFILTILSGIFYKNWLKLLGFFLIVLLSYYVYFFISRYISLEESNAKLSTEISLRDHSIVQLNQTLLSQEDKHQKELRAIQSSIWIRDKATKLTAKAPNEPSLSCEEAAKWSKKLLMKVQSETTEATPTN